MGGKLRTLVLHYSHFGCRYTEYGMMKKRPLVGTARHEQGKSCYSEM
jgi:hypothetical protein